MRLNDERSSTFSTMRQKNDCQNEYFLVANNGFGHAVPGYNIFPKEFDNDSCLSCPVRHNLHPFRHIVYSQEDILISKRIRKWSPKINPPNIKDLNNNYRDKGHHISATDFSKLLTPRTALTV